MTGESPRGGLRFAEMRLTRWVRRHPTDANGADPAAHAGAGPESRAGTGSARPVPPPPPAVDSGSPDWSQLVSEVATCTACGLHETRTQTVFGVGDRRADWMFIGEAPGAEEDRQGEPFVGRAGQLLDAMLTALGLDRQRVFIANVLKCRPPGNRDPRPEEAKACSRFLDRQIELIDPAVVVALGRIAAQHLLETDQTLGRLRGRPHRLAGSGRPLVVTYHPAYLLRQPAQKGRAWEDLLLARRLVSAAGETVVEDRADVRG